MRLFLQPTMAILFATRDGWRDARAGRPPYFWTVLKDPMHRGELLRNGLKAVGKVFIIAIVLDLVYQWIALRWLYLGEALLVAILLAIVPYMLMRGPVDRLVRRTHRATGKPRT
jgi:hypothetical protein